MRTNKQYLTDIVQQHFSDIKSDIKNRMETFIGNDDWYNARSIAIYEQVLINIYSGAIDWVCEFPNYDTAWVKPEIIKQGLGVAIGSLYYGNDDRLSYRLVDDNNLKCFQVYCNGVWQYTDSTNWMWEGKGDEVAG